MTTSDDVIMHASGLVGLRPVTQSVARRAGMRATEHVTSVPTFLVSRDIALGSFGQEAAAPRVTPTELLVIASARALLKQPAVHACLVDGRVHQYTSTRVAVLVRSHDALIPLVFPDAESTSASTLREERASLQQRLGARSLPADRMAAPTFVISNLGRFNVDWFTAVLFPQNAATLAVGRVTTEGGAPQIRVVLTCDHRIVDGVDAAEFLEALASGVADVPLA